MIALPSQCQRNKVFLGNFDVKLVTIVRSIINCVCAVGDYRLDVLNKIFYGTANAAEDNSFLIGGFC